MERTKVGIIEPGSISTDPTYKVMRSRNLGMKTIADIVESEGIRWAADPGFQTSIEGVETVVRDPEAKIVFGVMGAVAHMKHASVLREADKIVSDMTLAVVGPFIVPYVNLDHLQELDTGNYNMVMCGGQTAISIACVVDRAMDSEYTKIVARIPPKSAGPDTWTNIDEFIQTISKALHAVDGTDHFKAIIVLNLAEPPLMMSSTIYSIMENPDERVIVELVNQIAREVQTYVPGYSLRVLPIIDDSKVTVIVQMEGTGNFLPKYSGNLGIIDAAAVAVAEKVAIRMWKEGR